MPHKPTTILHTEWSKGWGGQEIRILAETQAFIARGYRMLIACQPDSQLFERASQAGVETIALVIRKGPSIGAILKTRRIIKQQKVDLVHTHSSVDAWKCGIAAKLSGIPVVRSRHLSTLIKTSPFSYFVYMKIADRVITSGQSIKDTMIRRNAMPEQNIVSAPAGIDEKRFTPDIDGSAIRQHYGFSSSDFVVGIVSVLRSWKGHDDLIDAIKILHNENKSVRLMIVGAGPQEQRLKERIEKEALHSFVVLCGHQSDVPAYIAAMDCFVLPSTKNEATSQVLPQAMAMQKPVIATDVGGLPEVVIDRQTGLLVPAHSATALAQAISWVHTHAQESAEMAARGRAHCLQHFTFDTMINTTEAVYQTLLAHKSAAQTDPVG